MKKGCKAHIPPIVMEELEDIKKSMDIEKQCEAFRIMAKNSNKFRNMRGGFKFTF